MQWGPGLPCSISPTPHLFVTSFTSESGMGRPSRTASRHSIPSTCRLCSCTHTAPGTGSGHGDGTQGPSERSNISPSHNSTTPGNPGTNSFPLFSCNFQSILLLTLLIDNFMFPSVFMFPIPQSQLCYAAASYKCTIPEARSVSILAAGPPHGNTPSGFSRSACDKKKMTL